MKFLPTWFPRSVTGGLVLILTRLNNLIQQVQHMADDLQTSIDQVKSDTQTIIGNVGQLQTTADTIADRLAAALANIPPTPDNTAAIAELQGIHADLTTLSGSIAATVAKDTPADAAPAGATTAPTGSGT